MPTDQVRAAFNAFVTRQLSRARQIGDIVAIEYWKSMFV